MAPVALITGSSRGIGRAIALALAERNFRLILHGKTDSDCLQATLDEVARIQPQSTKVVFDLKNVDRQSAVLDEIFSKFGSLHCLINNAGVSVKRRGDLLDLEEDSFEEQYLTNIRGTFFLTQGTANRMLKQPKDVFHSIINITSSNALAASPERGEYCMAKSALSMMSRLFAVRLASEDINVYEIRPGLINTDMTRSAKSKYDQKLAAGFTPINRWGQPGDIGSAVVPIAEGAFRFSTGEAFHLDGGMHIRHY